MAQERARPADIVVGLRNRRVRYQPCIGDDPRVIGKTVCPPLRLGWLALSCASEGYSGGPSRSSPQESEPCKDRQCKRELAHVCDGNLCRSCRAGSLNRFPIPLIATYRAWDNLVLSALPESSTRLETDGLKASDMNKATMGPIDAIIYLKDFLKVSR